jgi:hypothetical protein
MAQVVEALAWHVEALISIPNTVQKKINKAKEKYIKGLQNKGSGRREGIPQCPS